MTEAQKIATAIAQTDMRLFGVVVGLSNTKSFEDLAAHGYAVTLCTRAIAETHVALAKSVRASIMEDLQNAGALTQAAIDVLATFDPSPLQTEAGEK